MTGMEVGTGKRPSVPLLAVLLLLVTHMHLPVVAGFKCYVCTEETPGCWEGDLQSKPALAQECTSSKSDPAIGCMTIALEHVFPENTLWDREPKVRWNLLFRDCLHKDYLKCLGQQGVNAHKKNVLEIPTQRRNLLTFVNCMNGVRAALGLQPLATDNASNKDGLMHLALHVKSDLGNSVPMGKFTSSTQLVRKLAPNKQQVLECYVCTDKSSPKCLGALSSSDSDLIQACPLSKEEGAGTGKVAAYGCQTLVLEFRFQYPRSLLVYRDCLYPSDFKCYHKWGFGESWLADPFERQNMEQRSKLKEYVTCMNKGRSSQGLPVLPEDDIDDPEANYEYSPGNGRILMAQYFSWSPEFGTAKFGSRSNGGAIKGLRYGSFLSSYTAQMTNPIQALKCFVCTDSTPGCEGPLSSSNIDLVQECAWNEKNPPIGCQLHVVHYEYPMKPFVYRDCMYVNYLQCHGPQLGELLSLEMKKDRDWKSPLKTKQEDIDLSNYVGCINHFKSSLGVPPLPSNDIPDDSLSGLKMGALYFAGPGGTPDAWHVSNGASIKDDKVLHQHEQVVPAVLRDVECFICGDTKNKECKGYPAPCGPGAFGCATLVAYSDSLEWSQVVWARRECWYNGDLQCLRGRKKSPSLGRSFGGSGRGGSGRQGKCKARELIMEGQTPAWEGTRTFENSMGYSDYLNCRRNIRADLRQDNLAVTTEPSGAFPGEANILYYYCTGSRCNRKDLIDFTLKEVPRPTVRTTPRPGVPREVNDKRQPWECDKRDIECCECTNCKKSSSSGARIQNWWFIIGTLVRAR